MFTNFDSLELHLTNKPLSSANSRRIKDIGGRATACRRGWQKTRFVHIPASETEFAYDLIQEYGPGVTTTIARGGIAREVPAALSVQYIPKSFPLEQFLAHLKAVDGRMEPARTKMREERAEEILRGIRRAAQMARQRKALIEMMKDPAGAARIVDLMADSEVEEITASLERTDDACTKTQ